jgi:hypothetical protein
MLALLRPCDLHYPEFNIQKRMNFLCGILVQELSSKRIIVYPQRIMIVHTSAFAGTERRAHALDLLMKMSFEA